MDRLTEREPYWLGEEFWTSAREPDDEEIDTVYERLKYYEDMEEQGKLLILPCKPGDAVYIIQKRYTKCQYGQEIDESSCCGCEAEECDSKKEYCIFPMKSFLVWIVSNLERFGKTVFLTEQEAKEALEGMKHEKA